MATREQKLAELKEQLNAAIENGVVFCCEFTVCAFILPVAFPFPYLLNNLLFCDFQETRMQRASWPVRWRS